MDASKDQNPVRLFELCAIDAGHLHKFLEALSPSDHIHYVTANLDNKLLGKHNPRSEFWPKGMSTEVNVSIKTSAWNTFMELYHLPHCVQGHAP